VKKNVIGNVLKYMGTKKYQNRERFDKLIVKINCAVFASYSEGLVT